MEIPPLEPTLPFRQHSLDYSSLLFLTERFLSSHSSRVHQHLEWTREVTTVSKNFEEITGIKFSPSKIELLRKKGNKDHNDGDHEGIFPNSTGSLWTNKEIDTIMDSLHGISDREALRDHLTASLERSLDESAHAEFWSVYFEALYRQFASEVDWFLINFPDILDECKLSRRSKLKHLMFLEFFKLRNMIWKANPDWSQLSGVLSDLDVTEFASLYGELCKLELKSIGRAGKSQNTMSFLHKQVFPVMARTIPPVFIKAISERAFDSELFEDEIEKFKTCELNENVTNDWWSHNPLKSWNDSVSRKQISAPEENSKSFDESLAVVYEAPWVLPSVVKPDTKGKNDPKRQSVTIPARSLKMEGRRQSYVPAETDQHGSDALCIMEDQGEDGFSISRGILDAMREWSQEDTGHSTMMISDQPLGDVLQDLLQSPPQPCTRATSPVKLAHSTQDPESPEAFKKARITSDSYETENVPPSNAFNFEDGRFQVVKTSPMFGADSATSTALPSVNIERAKKREASPLVPESTTKLKTKSTPHSERDKRRNSRVEEDVYFELNAL